MKRIGFIGVGIMGRSMVRNLKKNGFDVQIYARHYGKVKDVVEEGVPFFSTIEECVKGCDAVITMVGFPQDVEDVYFGKDKILDCAAPGTYLIDMTTTSPSLAVRLFEEGTAKGFHVVDAPVTGGDIGAKKGTLSILVGGKRSDFEVCLPIFEAMGTNINYQGAAGCGQHAKIANQIMIAGTLSGLCEALAYSKEKGLNLQVLLNSVATGAAGSKQLDTYAYRMLAEDYAPGFFMKHFVKDLGIAVDEAEKSGLALDILKQTYCNSKKLENAGFGDYGNHVLLKNYEKSK